VTDACISTYELPLAAASACYLLIAGCFLGLLYEPVDQLFPNWWVASRFVVGRKKFLKSLKLNFNRGKLTEFWLSVQQTCPTLSTEALKVLLPFSSSYICEVGFSAMVGMNTKF
jgi:hypothetical protein